MLKYLYGAPYNSINSNCILSALTSPTIIASNNRRLPIGALFATTPLKMWYKVMECDALHPLAALLLH